MQTTETHTGIPFRFRNKKHCMSPAMDSHGTSAARHWLLGRLLPELMAFEATLTVAKQLSSKDPVKICQDMSCEQPQPPMTPMTRIPDRNPRWPGYCFHDPLEVRLALAHTGTTRNFLSRCIQVQWGKTMPSYLACR